MELIIRNNSGQPIYDQISGQIKAQILSGALSPGDALPSIRGLAKDLKISVITTKRAYDELEAFDYEEFKKNGFEVKRLGDVPLPPDPKM